MDADVERILDPSYLERIDSLPIDQVRSMRGECQDIETGLSYLRRVVQGRLDIVGSELGRRRDGGDPADLTSLIDRLPEILADRTRAPGKGRLPTSLDPGRPDTELEAELDRACGEDFDHLAGLSDERLSELQHALSELEHTISERRRALFDRIDALQAEITRRYRSGEASVESLLQ